MLNILYVVFSKISTHVSICTSCCCIVTNNLIHVHLDLNLMFSERVEHFAEYHVFSVSSSICFVLRI